MTKMLRRMYRLPRSLVTLLAISCCSARSLQAAPVRTDVCSKGVRARDTASVPADSGLVRRFRNLLTSKTQVADYQSLMYAVGALFDKVGAECGQLILHASSIAAYKFPRDSAAYRRLELNLAGHTFQSESLPPEPARASGRPKPTSPIRPPDFFERALSTAPHGFVSLSNRGFPLSGRNTGSRRSHAGVSSE